MVCPNDCAKVKIGCFLSGSDIRAMGRSWMSLGDVGFTDFFGRPKYLLLSHGNAHVGKLKKEMG